MLLYTLPYYHNSHSSKGGYPLRTSTTASTLRQPALPCDTQHSATASWTASNSLPPTTLLFFTFFSSNIPLVKQA